jgi:hypothetical protein
MTIMVQEYVNLIVLRNATTAKSSAASGQTASSLLVACGEGPASYTRRVLRSEATVTTGFSGMFSHNGPVVASAFAAQTTGNVQSSNCITALYNRVQWRCVTESYRQLYKLS